MFSSFANLDTFMLQGGGLSNPMVMIALVSVVWIFLVILPGRKEAKRKQEMLAALKKGDTIQTQAGIVGKVARTESETVVIETAGSKIEILRNTVVSVLDSKNG